MKKALITGITGQDGSYLAEILLAKGYQVHGLVRRSSNPNTGRLDAIAPDVREALHLHHGDLTDAASLQTVLTRVQPDEVYNLGAQSHVSVSFELPEYTSDVVGMGALRMLEACRGLEKKPRFYQASTSELFGRAAEVPQRETTPFHPRSPYGCAKAFAYHATVNYREAYGLHASNGILFNHESPRRGEQFVTRKITRAAARIQHGLQDELRLGNLDAVRDWGWAPDFCEAMWLMLQQDQPDDFVIATGEAHTVRDFLERAFARVNLDPKDFLRLDPSLRRPAEVDIIHGDPSKARQKLGWKPTVGFEALVDLMVDADLALAEREKFMRSRF